MATDLSKVVAQVRQRQQKRQQGGRSIFEQVRDAAVGVVPGIAHLGVSAVQEATGPARALIDYAGGHASGRELLGALVPGIKGGESYHPLTESLAQSGRRTYEDIIHPERFAQAAREGQIVGKVLEDIGNVALVAGPAAKAVGGAASVAEAADLARLGQGLRAAEAGTKLVARATGRTMDLQVAPLRAAGRGVLRGAEGLLERAAPETRLRYGRYVNPAQRSVSRLVRQSVPEREAAAASAGAAVARQLRAAEAAVPGVGEDLFSAARARMMGTDTPIRDFAQAEARSGPTAGLSLEDARRAVTAHDIEGHTVTPAAAKLLADYHSGAMPPELRAAFDGIVEEMRGVEQARRVRAEQGYGYSTPGRSLDVANRGVLPITPEIANLERRRVRVGQAGERRITRLERGLRRAEAGVTVPEGVTRGEIQRSLVNTDRLRRAQAARAGEPGGAPLPTRQVLGEPSTVEPSAVGVTARPESLLRGVRRTAQAQGEALGVAREADLTAGRGLRAPSTTRLTAEDLAQASQSRLLRRVQRAAGAPEEALAARGAPRAEGLLSSVEPAARRFGEATTAEAAARQTAREAQRLTGEELGRLEVNPEQVARSARAARDAQVADLRSQADALESQLRQITDRTGPIDIRQGVGGTEAGAGATLSARLGNRRLAITRYGQRLGIFAKAGEGRPVGMDVAAGVAEEVGLRGMNPDELAAHVVDQVAKVMDLRGEAGRIAKRAPEEHLGQQAMAELTGSLQRDALAKGGEAFDRDSAAGVKGTPGLKSLGDDKAAVQAYRMLVAERARATRGAATGRAGAELGAATAGVYGRGVEEGQRLGAAERLRSEGVRLTGRAEDLARRAQETGYLPEEMAQAQARQAARSFEAGQTAQRRLQAVRTAKERLDAARTSRDSALAAIDQKLAVLKASPESYPARWRPAMQANRRWVDHLRAAAAKSDPSGSAMLANMASEVPLLPEEMAAVGLAPEHVKFGEVKPLARQTAVSAGGVGPVRGIAAEYERSTDVTPMTAKNVYTVEAGEARTQVSNETVKLLTAPAALDAQGRPIFDPVTGDPVGGYARTLRSVLGDETLQDVFDRVEQRVVGERVANRTQAVRERLGQELTNEMAAKGYEPWDPRSKDLVAVPGQVTERTPFLPAGTADMVRKYWAPAQRNIVLDLMTKANSKWKGVVLPFSPRWQLGDAFGNYMMSFTGLAIDPLTLTRRLSEAARLGKADLLPQHLGEVGLGFSDAELLSLAERRPSLTPFGRGFRAIQQRSFALNGWLNATQRGAAYLELVDRNMAKGMVREEAVTRAVAEANKAMGNFAAMTPFERRYVQQVFPFYSWMRHITMLTTRLAIDHPARLVWTLHLGATWGKQEDLPDWAKGGIQVGGSVVPLTFLNPFSDVAGGPAIPFTGSGQVGLSNFGRSLSPVIKTGIAAALGMNPSREGWNLTRAGGATADQYGREVPVPLLGRPLELAGFAARQVPLLRIAQELAPAVGPFGPGLRYDTGEVRTDRWGNRNLGTPATSPRADVLGRQFVPLFPQALSKSDLTKQRRAQQLRARG